MRLHNHEGGVGGDGVKPGFKRFNHGGKDHTSTRYSLLANTPGSPGERMYRASRCRRQGTVGSGQWSVASGQGSGGHCPRPTGPAPVASGMAAPIRAAIPGGKYSKIQIQVLEESCPIKDLYSIAASRS